LILINLPGGMHAMTMHDGEGHALTGTTVEACDLFEHALDAIARATAMVPT